MELRHLRYFVAVAEAENVSRAALKLHVSQPALSRQIQDLEDELGFPLLERTAKSVRLSDAGRVFLVEARAVLERVEQAVSSARAVAAGKRSDLHVGYAPTLAVRLMPATLRAFQAAMPAVRVKLHDLSSEEIITGIREGKLHLGLSVRPSSGMSRGVRFEEVMQDPIRLTVSPNHPLARKRSVTVADAAREPLIAYSRKEYPDYHEMISTIFSGSKKQPQIAEEHDGVSSLISAVEVGNGVAVLSESTACLAGPRLKLLRLTPDPKPASIGVVMPKGELSVSAAYFVQCAKQALPAPTDK